MFHIQWKQEEQSTGKIDRWPEQTSERLGDGDDVPVENGDPPGGAAWPLCAAIKHVQAPLPLRGEIEGRV